MSMDCIISATLNANYNQCNITKILKTGESIGCTYFNREPEIYPSNKQKIPCNAAIDLVWWRFKTNYEYGPAIYTQYKNTMLYILFYKSKTNKIIVSLNIFFSPWEKEFNYLFTIIDLAQYNIFLFNLIGDLPILHFKSAILT